MNARNLGTGAVHAYTPTAIVPWQTTHEPLTTSALDASDVQGAPTEKNWTNKAIDIICKGRLSFSGV
jgi:hypothetical protein